MIRALIVDDEAPARHKLRTLVERAPGFSVVGEAADGDEAVERIRALRPEVVFLDVQMPKRDGFGVVAELGPQAMPLVVFVTAYDQHALRAFEVEALDYLLKPFAPPRLERVLERVRARLAAGDRMAHQLERLLQAAAGEPRWAESLLVERSPGRETLLAVEDIDLVRAERNALRIFAGAAEYVRPGPLSTLAERLDPAKFLRINRSEIVRLGAIQELQPWFHGDYRVLLKDGRQLSWSRRYRAKDKDRF